VQVPIEQVPLAIATPPVQLCVPQLTVGYVHCVDVPSGNTGCDHLIDFPGDIIRLHERHGWHLYVYQQCRPDWQWHIRQPANHYLR